MAIIRQYHKDTDTTYVYESVSYWDEEKKQSRSKRRVIGKIDPATGEIVPTGRRGRKPKEPPIPQEEMSSEFQRLYDESQARIRELILTIDQKDQEIARLQKEILNYRESFRKIDQNLAKCRELCADQAARP